MRLGHKPFCHWEVPIAQKRTSTFGVFHVQTQRSGQISKFPPQESQSICVGGSFRFLLHSCAFLILYFDRCLSFESSEISRLNLKKRSINTYLKYVFVFKQATCSVRKTNMPKTGSFGVSLASTLSKFEGRVHQMRASLNDVDIIEHRAKLGSTLGRGTVPPKLAI